MHKEVGRERVYEKPEREINGKKAMGCLRLLLIVLVLLLTRTATAQSYYPTYRPTPKMTWQMSEAMDTDRLLNWLRRENPVVEPRPTNEPVQYRPEYRPRPKNENPRRRLTGPTWGTTVLTQPTVWGTSHWDGRARHPVTGRVLPTYTGATRPGQRGYQTILITRPPGRGFPNRLP